MVDKLPILHGDTNSFNFRRSVENNSPKLQVSTQKFVIYLHCLIQIFYGVLSASHSGPYFSEINVGDAVSSSTRISQSVAKINSLEPNDVYIRRTAQLTSRRCILNIYSTNILSEYFKRAAHSPFFFSVFKMPFIS